MQWNPRLSEYIEALTLKDRFEALHWLYDAEQREHRFIFPIYGIELKSPKIQVGDICLYDAKSVSFGSEHSKFVSEVFGRDDSIPHVNATTIVKCVSPRFGANIAFRAIDETLDIISLLYSNKTTPVCDSSDYIYQEIPSDLWGARLGEKRDDQSRYLLGPRVSDQTEIQSAADDLKVVKENRASRSKILQALHWHRKAMDSTEPEDKLLYAWIVLEKLLHPGGRYSNERMKGNSKLNEILKSIDYFTIWHLVRTKAIHAFEMLREHTGGFGYTHEKINIPGKLLYSSQLRTESGQDVNLRVFVDHIDKLLEYMSKSSYVFSELKRVRDFFFIPSVTLKSCEQSTRGMRSHIQTAYYYRNLIVHNGYYSTDMLRLTSSICENVAQRVLAYLLHMLRKMPNESVEQLVVRGECISTIFLTGLKEGRYLDPFSFTDIGTSR